MSPRKEIEVNELYLTQTSSANYENLCRLDVLGLQDSPTGDQSVVHSEFEEQLQRSPQGWYETTLPWKGNHPPLADNKQGSLKRLNNLVRKLEKSNLLERYDEVIKDQLEQGIVERADEIQGKREFYIPHKPVVRESAEFLQSLKRLIARCGRPRKIYSDNGRTFVAAAKWIRAVMKDESTNTFLSKQGIKWQFNMSRAPWWGGLFERLIGLIKQSLNKTIGNGFLSLVDPREVVLDVEVALNNRPLSYVEDDVQLPILTPNSFLYGRSNPLPEIDPRRIERPS